MQDCSIKVAEISYFNIPFNLAVDSVINSPVDSMGAMQDPLELSISSPDLLICLTVYNEPGEALLFSLLGLFNNLDYLTNAGCERTVEPVVCIIFDGLSKISPSSISILNRLGLWSPQELEANSGFHVFESTLRRPLVEEIAQDIDLNGHKISRWGKVYRDSLIESQAESLETDQQASDCKVIVCIKEENAGKLNSHWCFFQLISSELEPKYCLPMDVGTVPNRTFLYELWSYMEANPDVGAAASCTLVPEPDRRASLLDIWQYGSFYREKLFYWPGEALSGYLSVIPGQFSILRWSSLTATTANFYGSYSDSRKDTRVLDRYYRGLLQLPPLERNLFLAEDRVIGLEIATSSSAAWKTGFVPSAIVITDPCDSFTELLRQRRRWINSGFAARLFLLPTLLLYFLRNPVKLKDKFGLLRSTLLHSSKLITEWFLPSVGFVLIFTAYKEAKVAVLDHSLSAYWVDIFLVGLFTSALATHLRFFRKDGETKVERFLSIFIMYLTSCGVIGLILLIYLGNFRYLPFYIFMPVGMSLGILATLAMSPFKVSNLRSKTYVYLHHLLEFSFLLVLYVYAFFNINDFSWGTKGLQCSSRKQYSFGKNLLWFITIPWVVSNILFVYLLMFTEGYLDIFFLFVCSIVATCYVFYIGSGLIYFAKGLKRFHVGW